MEWKEGKEGKEGIGRKRGRVGGRRGEEGWGGDTEDSPLCPEKIGVCLIEEPVAI